MEQLRQKEEELRKINSELDSRKNHLTDAMSKIDREKLLKAEISKMNEENDENEDPNQDLDDLDAEDDYGKDNNDHGNYSDDDDTYNTHKKDTDKDRPYITQQIDEVHRKEEMRKLRKYEELLEQNEEQGNNTIPFAAY